MTIGRAVSLCLRNIGGQRAGDTSRTVFGQPARFGLCFGEWEERSPWPSLAERRGFTAEQEVMTVHGGKGTFPMADVNNDSAEDLAYTIAKTISFPLNNWYLEPTGESGQLVLCDQPDVGRAVRQGRWPNVEDFQQYLWECAWQPIDLFRPGNAEVLETKGRVDDQGRVALVRTPRAARAGRVRRPRQPARGRAHELLRERDAERGYDARLTRQKQTAGLPPRTGAATRARRAPRAQPATARWCR